MLKHNNNRSGTLNKYSGAKQNPSNDKK